jgi:flavin-dependent dehydrogenase
MRVCLLDAAALPSDQPFSTHAIQPKGMDYLEELGVAADVRAGGAPVRTTRLSVGRAYVDLAMPPGREMYCPRRTRLDRILQENAVARGAELRDRTSVLDVIREGERVVGVRARGGGRTYDIRSRFVVGADGRNSTVARRVGAEEYLRAESARGGYWSYWPSTPAFERLGYETIIDIQGEDSRAAFRTDDGLVIAVCMSRVATVRQWSADIERHFRKSMAATEATATLLEGGGAPVTPFVGLLKASFYFRQPVGPGWALVGDAGLHKDPTAGYGITDALRDARALSRALLDGRREALEVYWRQRDVESIPLFENASQMGSIDYDNPFNEIVLNKLRETPSLHERMRDVIDRKLSPFDMIPIWRVLAWAGSALLRGKTEILPHFLESGRRGAFVQREAAKRQALLARAKQRLSDAAPSFM